MTGAELAAIRKAAGLSQTELAQRAGIGRHAVSYWECKAKVERSAWAVERMGEVLTLPDALVVLPVRRSSIDRRAQEMARQDALMLNTIQAVEARLKAIKANRRVRCKAKTRKGTACQMKSEPGKRRCKFHGGRSTGPTTVEGRARIAEAQRKRWARWRTSQAVKAAGLVS
ncbi:HGGxSTG domain-containing protein [Paracoccus sediminilitoris]|uniref:HGGxSTG domain-containing protein n=1 Tax=Paracoccus sediminilitoris TaxID=2202419 RepID=UPI0018F716DA|nr:HGGxSTG domain-containing protein [Paracoccus sediminilitoris]